MNVSDKKSSSRPLTKQDKFARNIANSLDDSLLSIDSDTLKELKEKRDIALAQKKSPRINSPYVWSGIAAAVIVAIALPIYFNQSSQNELEHDIASYYDVDPEMLEMMDMLLVLGDLIEEDPDAI
ncbi:hypothetical protein NBRC116493_06970 [Aurantivibrio infirmus]